jgi:hypothetical protein
MLWNKNMVLTCAAKIAVGSGQACIFKAEINGNCTVTEQRPKPVISFIKAILFCLFTYSKTAPVLADVVSFA